MTDLRPYLRAVSGSSKLTMRDRVVLFALAWYANDTGHAWPSSDTLGKACGVHPDNVRRALGHLVQAGVITAETRRGRSTVYRFPLHPSTTCGRDDTGEAGKPVVEMTQTCVKPEPNLWPRRHTELLNVEEEEGDPPVNNYGDARTASRMRSVLEAARTEAKAATS